MKLRLLGVALALAPAGFASSEDTIEYVVEPGETLWSIAAQTHVYADPHLWPLIYKSNRDQIVNPGQIYPDQTLIIPIRVERRVDAQ